MIPNFDCFRVGGSILDPNPDPNRKPSFGVPTSGTLPGSHVQGSLRGLSCTLRNVGALTIGIGVLEGFFKGSVRDLGT